MKNNITINGASTFGSKTTKYGGSITSNSGRFTHYSVKSRPTGMRVDLGKFVEFNSNGITLTIKSENFIKLLEQISDGIKAKLTERE